MAYAHEHQRTMDIASSDATSAGHHHAHHKADDSDAVDGTGSVFSSIPAHDCDTEPADAVATPRAPLSPVDLRVATAVAPPAPASRIVLWDFAPPGASSESAYLNPLRI
jgi:hypothetical protein